MKTKTAQPLCPECEKLVAVSEESNKIGAFLEWLSNDTVVVLAKWREFETPYGKESELVIESQYYGNSGINKLLADYYNIDLDKVDQERKALLEWIRERDEN